MGRSAGHAERSEHRKKRKARPKVHADEPVDQAGVVEAKAVDKPRLSLRADKGIACPKCGSQCTTEFCGECGAALGEQPVGFEGKSFDGMSEQEVTREIKDSTFTGKLELIRLKEDGGVDLPGAPAAAGDGKREQRQEAAEKTLTEADKKFLEAAKEGKLQEAKDALGEGAKVDAAATSQFKVGDCVEGNFEGKGRYYPGKIDGITLDGRYNIMYNDGDKEARVPGFNLRAEKPLTEQCQEAAEQTLTEADETLLNAAREGKLQEAKEALNDGARVDAVDEEHGLTPLDWAAMKGGKEMVGMLIEKGANVNAAKKDGETPLHTAANGGHKEIAEIMIEKGAKVDAADKNGETPLYNAAQKGHKEIVEILIDKGAKVDAKDKYGETPLYCAARYGHKEIAEMLIERRANVDAASKNGETPLYNAAQKGHKEIVEILIDKGADVNAVDEDGETPLHGAAKYGRKEIVGMLIEGGANVLAASKNGETPLYYAAQEGHKEIAEVLTEEGANVDAVTKTGESPLDESWENDPSSPLTLLLLLKSKIGIDSMSKRHSAAKLGAQLGKLIKDIDEGNKEVRQWLGTWAKNEYGDGEEGLWVKGGDTVVRLLLRILSEGQSSLVVPLFEKLLVPSTPDRYGQSMMDGIRVAAMGSETKMLTYPAADWPDTANYLHNKRESDPQRYRRLNQGDHNALPVKGFVFALKGVLAPPPSHRRLLSRHRALSNGCGALFGAASLEGVGQDRVLAPTH
jgi:ankyrin repeat protein